MGDKLPVTAKGQINGQTLSPFQQQIRCLTIRFTVRQVMSVGEIITDTLQIDWLAQGIASICSLAYQEQLAATLSSNPIKLSLLKYL